MRFFLRILLLPMLLTLSLPAQAQSQPQTLQMTSIHDVALGMSLDEGISALRQAGFGFRTTSSGDIEFKSETAEHYEGTPEFLRAADGFLDRQSLIINLSAMRAPDAADDDWAIIAVNQIRSFLPPDQPRYEDFFAQLHEGIGVDQASCSPTNSKWDAIFAFNSAGAFIAGNGALGSCRAIDESGENLGALVVVRARPSREDEGRVKEVTLALMDAAAMKTQRAIAAGTYGKAALTGGDF